MRDGTNASIETKKKNWQCYDVQKFDRDIVKRWMRRFRHKISSVAW